MVYRMMAPEVVVVIVTVTGSVNVPPLGEMVGVATIIPTWMVMLLVTLPPGPVQASV